MKKVILCAVLTVFGMNVSAKEKKVWEYSDGKLEKVFTIDVSSKSNEVLRLYDDGTYEHLKYSQKSSGREQVERSLGNYVINRSKITFSVPKEKSFSGKFRYGTFFYNGKLYSSFLDMKVRKKNELFRSTRDKKFFKPFFICLNSDEVVHNKESAEQLDLNRLMSFILKDKNTEEDKVMAIIQLIVGSIEYDYDGYHKDIYANKQDDVKGILAGNKRLAVCAGYSFVMKELCDIAGIKADKVHGNTKQTFADLMHLGGYHAWNIIEVEGEKRLYDVTWADDGETIDMRWVDVDPLVMIGTHFPDMKENQLVANPVSQEQFLNSAVITPISGSANPIAIHLPARQFAGNNFRMAIPGKHKIIASLVPSEMAETVYASELKSGSRSYSPKHIGSGHFDGDSTYFTIPLTEAINPLEIEIDGQIEIKTVVFKGGQSDLMNYYITKADKKRCDSYVKGVIAAIRVNDITKLKELVGSDNPLFFDKKGKLKLDKKVTLACLDWTGDLTSLTRTRHINMAMNDEGEYESTEEEELHIDIPDKLKLTLTFDGQVYTVSEIKTL
jgi:hypothetical protein